jgi:murein DD-endopeptidase MepM/ murein hydrolase activator NlpD
MLHLDAHLSRRAFLGFSAAAAAALSPLGRHLTAAAALPTYVLPYPGGFVWQCVQGNNSGGSHSGRAAFAWDFRMPQGSPILAARDGLVGMLKQDSFQSCPQNIYSCPDWNNYIVIDHGDGSSAAYLHGFQNGGRVRLGQRVKQGDVIGISGTTGQSGGPHLHFQVQHTNPALYIAQSFAIGFAEVSETGGVPVRRGTYRSGNVHVPDFDIRGGHYYTQTNGTGSPSRGFAVTDEAGVPMWSTLVGGGGAGTIGYPLSRRFHLDGTSSVCQVFQRQVFDWSMDLKRMRAINISELPATPLDPASWLQMQTAIPLNPNLDESDRTWNQYATAQMTALDSEPRIKAAYWSVDDPIRHFGLPLGPVTETPNAIQLKTAYASFQISKRDSAFAKTGDLTVSSHGDLILDAEPFSRRAFEPEPLFPDETIALLIPAA